MRKTLEQIQAEIDNGDVLTFEEFFDEVGNVFHPYNGSGYFHDGQQETDISVWSRMLSLLEIKKYPYVIWYNK